MPGLVTFSHNSHCSSVKIDIALDRPKKKKKMFLHTFEWSHEKPSAYKWKGIKQNLILSLL